MSNLALQLIDEVIEKDSFVVDSDEKAEWALSKIKEEQQELMRMEILCNNMIENYRLRRERANEEYERKTMFLRGQLQQYFETVSPIVTKTQSTYRLASGTLKLKKQQPEFKRDDAKLLVWLKSTGNYGLIKVTESADWAELKKHLVFDNGLAVTKDGELVEGVQVIDREPKFEIEF